ncbi:MAG: 16S rRNA (cytosine(1402)-N(4))-methyltransferase RsmH [Planctomycetes bacterium]|nr:16S rRNA (cytosine(1402)-N(4))-methyltransferase RsmH [Planctomycetota bacterium]
MHTPVLINEVISLLSPRPGAVYIDGTLGAGGHSRAILEASAPDGIVLGFDWDDRAVDVAAEKLAPFGERVRLIRRSYAEMDSVVDEMGFSGGVDGILLDLGLSSMQLSDPGRGFSFKTGGLLDMRMSRSLSVSAAELVNRLPEKELADLIYRFGDERRSRAIARAIVNARARGPVETAEKLADIVLRSGRRRGRWQIHPATRTFQALRIAVNDELSNLEKGLAAGRSLLAPGGVLAVISFHSLEDRIVKRAFREWSAGDGDFVRLVKKPITPSDDEVFRNPRARSARLRAVKRMEE